MTKTTFSSLLLAAAGATVVAGVVLVGQSAQSGAGAGPARPSTTDSTWATYGGDLGNRRYVPFDQINAKNFGDLEVAWRFSTANLGPSPEYSFQSTPLVVDGVLYTTAGSRRSVVALDAATGEMLWMHREDEGQRGANGPRRQSGRGLAYWTDGSSARIVYVTPGYRMIALDAKTGRPIPGFGNEGVVDLKQGLDQEGVDPVTAEIGLAAAPVIAKDVIVVGAAHGVGTAPRSMTNVKGYVRGFDVRTGRRLWIFHTIPRPGEFGYDSWENGAADRAGNAGAWTQISVDPELNLAYLPIELPTGDHYGGHRPGNGLFGESLVAVDLHTGVRRWHFQLVHHGLWDSDVACPPILADITVGGRAIKAVAVPTKQGFLFVFDRATGVPVWPIEERPVPKGDVPGEWYSPTQPFPTRPAPFERQGVSVDDLIDFTPELRAEALEVVKNYRMGPLFTPPSLADANGTWGTLTLPNNQGGANWPGGFVRSRHPDALRLLEDRPGQFQHRAGQSRADRFPVRRPSGCRSTARRRPWGRPRRWRTRGRRTRWSSWRRAGSGASRWTRRRAWRRSGRGPSRRPRGSPWRRSRWGRWWWTRRTRAFDHQAAVRSHHGVRPQPRRDPLAGRAR